MYAQTTAVARKVINCIGVVGDYSTLDSGVVRIEIKTYSITRPLKANRQSNTARTKVSTTNTANGRKLDTFLLILFSENIVSLLIISKPTTIGMMTYTIGLLIKSSTAVCLFSIERNIPRKKMAAAGVGSPIKYLLEGRVLNFPSLRALKTTKAKGAM